MYCGQRRINSGVNRPITRTPTPMDPTRLFSSAIVSATNLSGSNHSNEQDQSKQISNLVRSAPAEQSIVNQSPIAYNCHLFNTCHHAIFIQSDRFQITLSLSLSLSLSVLLLFFSEERVSLPRERKEFLSFSIVALKPLFLPDSHSSTPMTVIKTYINHTFDIRIICSHNSLCILRISVPL